MKGYNKWGYKPYTPLDRPKDKPYIQGLLRKKNGFLLEYMINGSGFLDIDGKKIPLTENPINTDGLEYSIYQGWKW